MSSSNIIIPSDLNGLIGERERVLEAISRSANCVGELNHLASQIPNCAPAVLSGMLSRENTPPAELEAVLPALRNELENIKRLQSDLTNRRAEIEQIKKRDKNIVIAIVAATVVFIIILIAAISS